MTRLADAVLPLIRTRVDLHRWSVANAHGAQLHEAVTILEEAVETEEPADVLSVTQRAITSALTEIMRADDSSGIIGDACRGLLELHPRVAARARPPAVKLVDWMMKFQFDQECDYFQLDPVAYAPALGDKGVASYRARLAEVEQRLGPRPPQGQRWSSTHRREWFTLDWNARRLAVLDRDVEAVIRTHVQDRKVAAWFYETAEALEEIGEIDLAIDWAKQAADFDHGHQSLHAADYWCAGCWPSTDPANCSKPASSRFADGRPRALLPTCTGMPVTGGPAVATRSWRLSPDLLETPCCSRS